MEIYKKKFLFLIILTLITAFLEILLLGSIIPLFSELFNNANNETFFEKILLKFLPDYFLSNKLMFLTIVFCVFAILVGISRMFLLRFGVYLTAKLSCYTGKVLFRETLYKPFSFHIKTNSSELISTITQKNNDISNSIMSIVLLFSNLILFLSIFFMLFYLNTIIILVISLSFLLAYLLIEYFSRKNLLTNSRLIAYNQNNVVKFLQESFSGIKEIILQKLQNFYLKLFSESNEIIQNKIAQNRYIGQYPRYIIETLSLILLSLLIIIYEKKNYDIIEILPLLTAIALGVQRLLPLMQQIYFNFTNIVSKKSSLDDYIEIFETDNKSLDEIDGNNKISFNKNILFTDIHFYFSKKKIFENMNIEIKKNSKIGIIGKTGNGKTTFINLLLGLLEPSVGKILVDGDKLDEKNLNSWTNYITYIPQEIFLFDGTIAENIAIGKKSEDIDFKRIQDVSRNALILDTIKSKPNGFNEIIGEKGIKLSAGERQRIGMARALYQNPNFLILDEATSALDFETEKLIMENLNNFNKEKTFIIIAHRINTLDLCDKIYEIENFKLKDVTNNFKK